jgi:hypothetical protein
MKPKFYTAIRVPGGRVAELQFWPAQGEPSLLQIQDLIRETWPEAAPEQIVFSYGLNSFGVRVASSGSAEPLVEEKVPLP